MLTKSNMNITINPIRKSTANLPISNLPGIGRHTPRALKLYGINTVNQFSRFTESEIVALLGKSGKKLLFTAKKIAKS